MLLKVGTQVSNALKVTLTKFYQHLSTGSQVFEGGDNDEQRLTTRSRLCYRPHREITRCGQKSKKELYRNHSIENTAERVQVFTFPIPASLFPAFLDRDEKRDHEPCEM